MPDNNVRPSSNHFSLRRRLLVSSTLVLLLFLGVTGLALDRAFERSLVSGQAERLFLRVLNLLSESEPTEDSLWLPRFLAEERYNSPESGLMALVLNDQREIVWRSLSSDWLESTEWMQRQAAIAPGQEQYGEQAGFVYERYAVIWETESGEERLYEYWVLEDAAPLYRSLRTFRNQLWGGLVTVTIALLVSLGLVARWGLMPLRTLALNLQQIRTGDKSRLEGPYPDELRPLTDNLNRLLAAEQGQRERYRQAMADLAHSLKTPLAVMRTLNPGDESELNEQVRRMDQIIRYQLQRAVTEARSGPVLGQRSSLSHALSRLGSALGKAFLADDKVLDLPESTDSDWQVAMDNNDLLEVFGNLLENGFKYSRSVISVSVTDDADKACWVVDIDDDGPGISPGNRQQALTRGKRLDTLQPGQGIGLSIVNDILASYDVRLHIYTSPLGGARFRMALPKA